MFTISCRCGYHETIEATKTMAEVIAERHESTDIRRPYRHNTQVQEVLR